MENNQKTAIQEMDETAKRREAEKLSAAVKLVNEAISAEYDRVKALADTEEGEPIMIEGETTTGHFCRMLVDPKDVAKLALEYNYPVWKVLEEDFPDDMWRELGRKFGLETVCAMDL